MQIPGHWVRQSYEGQTAPEFNPGKHSVRYEGVAAEHGSLQMVLPCCETGSGKARSNAPVLAERPRCFAGIPGSWHCADATRLG